MTFIIGHIQSDTFVTKYLIKGNDKFPNNERLAVLHYKDILELPALMPARYLKGLFAEHRWTNAWDEGIYTYHHYHSITHEVLGIYKGKMTILLGGEALNPFLYIICKYFIKI